MQKIPEDGTFVLTLMGSLFRPLDQGLSLPVVVEVAKHSERVKKTRQTEEEVGRSIREWTGLEFSRSQRAVVNREKYRKLVVKSSVVPK